jgi:hypothetical protein
LGEHCLKSISGKPYHKDRHAFWPAVQLPLGGIKVVCGSANSENSKILSLIAYLFCNPLIVNEGPSPGANSSYPCGTFYTAQRVLSGLDLSAAQSTTRPHFRQLANACALSGH